MLAFLIGVAAVIITLMVAYFGFNNMLTVVDELATPNQKLITLHNLIQRVAELEHRQRLEAIEKPTKPDQDFLRESTSLLVIVDSLRRMPWKDSLQQYRLSEMQRILHKRDSLFIKYLQLKSNSLRNKRLSKRFDTLAGILSKNIILRDSSVRTTQKKKIIVSYSKDSTIHPLPQKRSFLSRLFKKKQSVTVVQRPKEKITEETVVTIDTVALALRNNSVAEATKLIQELGKAEMSRRVKLAYRELALLKTTKILFSQMADIVHQVESEEILSAHENIETATIFFNDSLRKMILLLVVFCLLTATLVYFIVIDITRSNYYKVRLTEEKQRAEELSVVKQRFLDNMSHEIRTPIQSIIGFSEQLLKKITPETRPAIRTIHSSSEHLLHVVNEVLDYSRLDSGKLVFEEKKFYLLETAEEVALAMKVQAEKKGLHFYFDDDGAENCIVAGDPFRLKQILYNLIGNAVKFTNKGNVRVIFKTERNETQTIARFRIIDTGIGIQESQIEKIFQRFEQADPMISSVYGGSGLGLTIAKKLIETQGGTLTVISSHGKGSEFSFDLTFVNTHEEPSIKLQVRSKLLSQFHVLVVDDDNSILQLCNAILHSTGIRCSIQNEPSLLYNHALDQTITHVLMDVRMGAISGVNLANFLRGKIKREVKIIGMSAMPQIRNDSKFNAVFDAVLMKPFRSEELMNALEGVLTEKPMPIQIKDSATAIKQLTLNDSNLLRSALSDFIRETENDLAELENAANNRGAEDVKNILHKMKGRIAQFGHLSLSTTMSELENLLEADGSVTFFQREMSQLKRAIEDLISETRKELVRLN